MTGRPRRLATRADSAAIPVAAARRGAGARAPRGSRSYGGLDRWRRRRRRWRRWRRWIAWKLEFEIRRSGDDGDAQIEIRNWIRKFFFLQTTVTRYTGAPCLGNEMSKSQKRRRWAAGPWSIWASSCTGPQTIQKSDLRSLYYTTIYRVCL